MESMLHPPRTALELFKILPEGTRCQLIEDHIIMSPSPIWKHQDIVKIILFRIESYLRKNPIGKVLSDVDIYINEKNVYRPDIFFVADEQMDILGDDGYVHGAPHLVIEVLSPRASRYDKTKKKEIYAQYGVKEYWLIDPQTLQCTGFINESNSFTPLPSSQGAFMISLLDLMVHLKS
ncbi:Uma2 family endonuclease [Parafilimonas sp.]|uniref:Uma2 family endonuclease n=1 Tax=Parafilimonas sp. TaxID=1969739 RepID=UPI0039E40421